MKPKTILVALCVMTLLAVLSVMAFGHRSQPASRHVSGMQTFEVFGQIRSLDLANKTVRIAHEEIPNYMPAMTMPFTVKDKTLLKELRVDDRVKFELTVSQDDSWISRIEKTMTDAAGEAETIAPAASPRDRETERIQVGEMVPDFGLIDQDDLRYGSAVFAAKRWY